MRVRKSRKDRNSIEKLLDCILTPYIINNCGIPINFAINFRKLYFTNKLQKYKYILSHSSKELDIAYNMINNN